RLFIARAAHELRTPLSIMMLELANVKDPSGKRLETDLEAMSEIVERLLLLSRLQTIEKPSLQPVDVSTLARELVARMLTWVETHGHKLRFDSRSQRLVLGDESSLRDAIRNLIENAVKHTPPGTDIHVQIAADGAVVVEDSGPGLGAHSHEELQQPFRKGSEKSTGAGLGLAIVSQTVELHGGTLEMGSSPSLGGARFVLRFPPARSLPQAA
ncbi:MAG: HAMP domain-containing histidine kinase, partial [Proteobacteria bacterium]|nr:HAMP domain-containing histidine kinase [Pseudomonadota bacterium]